MSEPESVLLDFFEACSFSESQCLHTLLTCTSLLDRANPEVPPQQRLPGPADYLAYCSLD